MKEKINLDLFGACGDECSYCPRYKATLSNDNTDLERVKELWVLFGWRKPEVSIEELKCWGCGKGNACAYQTLRDCAFGKDLQNCGMCRDYPCGLAKAAFEKTEHAFSACKSLCSGEEMDTLTKAFRYKKTNLDRIHTLFSRA
jgi:hypothetical protein